MDNEEALILSLLLYYLYLTIYLQIHVFNIPDFPALGLDLFEGDISGIDTRVSIWPLNNFAVVVFF